MQRAVFCVCPPGISQHTLRVYRAIIHGCIPVTYFKANDGPYQVFSGVNYSHFTVNINPDEAHLTQSILRSLLAAPDTITEMQLALGDVQHYYVWDNESKAGVHWQILRELLQHPARRLH